MAQRLASAGYSVLLPNVFYRTGRPPLFTFKVSFGDERTRQRFGELVAPLNPAAIERDASAYVDFLSAQPSVAPGQLGVVGYCFSGAVALRIAAARPDRIAVAASFHGGGLYTDAETSPHLCLPRVKARLYFGHAVKDRSMSETAIEKLDAALRAWGGRYESVTYDGALHGWTMPDSQIYNQEQAERAMRALIALLASELPGTQ
jgi:carboxymethylenebutenolidase